MTKEFAAQSMFTVQRRKNIIKPKQQLKRYEPINDFNSCVSGVRALPFSISALDISTDPEPIISSYNSNTISKGNSTVNLADS